MKPQSHWYPAVPVALLGVAATSAQAAGQRCCELLQQAGLGDRLVTADSAVYTDAESTYWSLDNAELAPSCVLMPQTAEEVATAVTALAPDCNFAVRGAGHMANPGANNIHDGVTIDFGHMNTTTYDASKSLTSIQPGARWGSVYTELAKSEVMVLGGRASTVGVSGLLLGGGNSFYSSERGFACDGVVNYEVVLADGSIVHANETGDHADLYRALKGGSSNFGVVTRYDLGTFTAPASLWGGTIAYLDSSSSDLIAALEKFIAVLGTEDHRSDSAIVFWTYTQGSGATEPTVISALHNVGGVVDAPGLAELAAVPGNITYAMRTDTLVGFTDELEVPRGSYNSWRALTFQNDGAVMHHAVELYRAMIAEVEAEAPTLGMTAQCMFQGISVNQFQAAARTGGNVLGLQDRTENLVMFLGMLAYKDHGLEGLVNEKMTAWVDDIKAFADANGKDDEYLFLNYSDLSQNPLAGYGAENLAFMKQVAAKYDPEGVFQTRVPGGFKLSKA